MYKCINLSNNKEPQVMNQVITKEEITGAIKALKVGKAVGTDGIPAELLEESQEGLINNLIRVYIHRLGLHL